MIAVTILGGFLGAGKTTWLRSSFQELIRGVAPVAVAVLVNDFADHGVDDALLSEKMPDGTSVHAITSGCICCDKLQDLMLYLGAAVEASHRPGSGAPQRIIIETSGMADPAPILAAIEADPVVRTNIQIEETIVIVDGQNGLSQFHHHPLSRAQLMSADRVVISKADIADKHRLARLHGAITHLNPGIEVTGTSLGRETPLPAGDKHQAVEDDLWGSEGNPQPTATVLAVSANVEWEEFALWYDALIRTNSEKILRSKGTVFTPAGPLVLQSVGPTVPAPLAVTFPAKDCPSSTAIVFITAGIDPEALRSSFRLHVPTATAR